jgi:hypothetical protein
MFGYIINPFGSIKIYPQILKLMILKLLSKDIKKLDKGLGVVAYVYNLTY